MPRRGEEGERGEESERSMSNMTPSMCSTQERWQAVVKAV